MEKLGGLLRAYSERVKRNATKILVMRSLEMRWIVFFPLGKCTHGFAEKFLSAKTVVADEHESSFGPIRYEPSTQQSIRVDV